jgi:xanthine phosphoribosyltransferase
MQLLHEKILQHGRHLGDGILKVDAFMNHQLDSLLMRAVGKEFAEKFAGLLPSRILTAETSGIAPALAVGMELGVPVVFARKHQPITMAPDPYREKSTSPTHKREVELIVSTEYMTGSDRVLIIDDFLSSARTLLSLEKLVSQSGAKLVGIGCVIEKQSFGGREQLKHITVPIVSLAVIERFDGDEIILATNKEVVV